MQSTMPDAPLTVARILNYGMGAALRPHNIRCGCRTGCCRRW